MKTSHILYERSDSNMNSDYGRLSVSVCANNISMPIDNAKVTITDRDNQRVIEELTTDSSGQTPLIDLPAPPVEYSLEYSNMKPYSEYNVSVRSDGFENLEVDGIQIVSSST